MQRVANVSVDGIGWNMRCPKCPLAVHAKALKQESPNCCAGVLTNVQGAVTLTHCEYYVKDSVKSTGGKITFDCIHGDTERS